MVRIGLGLLLICGLLLAGTSAWASAQTDIQAANSQGKAVFVVVTQAGAQGADTAMQIAQRAQTMAPNSAIVVLDRGIGENQVLVQQYRLLGAPVPLILVVASNGVVAGGALLKDLTPDKLVKLIPTPKKAEMLQYLTKGAPVIVVASREKMPQRPPVVEACKQAWTQLEGKVATVFVDMDDRAEKAFLEELVVNPKELVPTTVVFNAKGQKTQVFRRAMTAKELVQAVLKKMPCCPGGDC